MSTPDAAPAPAEADNEVPWSDDLEKLGFEFADPGVMYLCVGPGRDGPQVVVTVEDNTFRDDFGLARSMSLYWRLADKPHRLSVQHSIRDNPTLGQIKNLVAALKGE